MARALRELVADVPSARNAVQAVEGSDASPEQELDAARFLSGLPNAPGEWDEDCTKDVVLLQRRVGRRVYGAVHVLVSRVLELNHAARSAPAITLEGRTCWSNLGALGMHPPWCLLSLSRRALHAWRDEAAANGPNCRNPASIEAGFVGRSRGWPEMSAWSDTGCPASLLGLGPIEAAGMSL